MNKYSRVLAIGGAAALVIGGIIALVANKAAGDADFSAQFYQTLLNNPNYADAVSSGPERAWMWFGIVLAILGTLALIGFLIARAGQTEKPPNLPSN